MADTPFWSGKDAKIVFVMDNKKLELLPKTWNVKENAEIIADDVGGEDRSRLDKIINFYEWSLVTFQKDLKPLMALLNFDAKLDTRTQPFECAAGILIYPRNGTRVGAEGREMMIDDWNFDAMPGRKERGMLTIPFRTRYFEPTKSI